MLLAPQPEPFLSWTPKYFVHEEMSIQLQSLSPLLAKVKMEL